MMKFNFLFSRAVVFVIAGMLVMIIIFNGLRIYNLQNPAEQANLVQDQIPLLKHNNHLLNIENIPHWHLFKQKTSTLVNTRKTRLNIQLSGIISSSIDGQARAIIAESSRRQAYFKVGDEIMPGVLLKAIGVDSIIIDNHKSDEIVQLNTHKNNDLLLRK